MNIDSRYDYTNKLCENYADSTDSKPLFNVSVGESFLKNEIIKNPHLSPDMTEHIYLSSCFYRKIISFGGFMLHSSCILYKGKSYLFSAASKTGKSTHTRLWQTVFGEQNVRIINDDKPLIRFVNGIPYACGTPFSGGTDKNINISAPIGAVVFLEQSKDNSIEKMPPVSALPLIIEQTTHSRLDEKTYTQLLNMIESLVSCVPLYRMKCNMQSDAARLAEKTITIQE